MTEQESVALVQQAVHFLGEQFDVVQVMVSVQEEGNTKSLYRGCGNWYARQGMAHEFIKADEAQGLAQQIATHFLEPE